MVTQTETRAIKASENKSSKTFQRKLTALYTPATLEVRVRRIYNVPDAVLCEHLQHKSCISLL